MSAARSQPGFTLIELMVTLAVVAVIAIVAAPSMQAFLDKNRVVGAAEAIYTQIQSARSEAVKQSANMVLVFASGSSWCSGFSRQSGADCDCTATVGDTNACSVIVDGTNRVLKVVDGGDFPGVTMDGAAPASITIDGVRGTTSGNDTILLQSSLGHRLQVEVNAIGAVRLCSPSGSVGGYPSC